MLKRQWQLCCDALVLMCRSCRSHSHCITGNPNSCNRLSRQSKQARLFKGAHSREACCIVRNRAAFRAVHQQLNFAARRQHPRRFHTRRQRAIFQPELAGYRDKMAIGKGQGSAIHFRQQSMLRAWWKRRAVHPKQVQIRPDTRDCIQNRTGSTSQIKQARALRQRPGKVLPQGCERPLHGIGCARQTAAPRTGLPVSAPGRFAHALRFIPVRALPGSGGAGAAAWRRPQQTIGWTG